MKNQVTHIKNQKTEKIEAIKQIDLQMKDWGFAFFVETELDAYKIAHAYSPKKVGIEYSKDSEMFYVTVYKDNN
jgi:hypothetical protein